MLVVILVSISVMKATFPIQYVYISFGPCLCQPFLVDAYAILPALVRPLPNAPGSPGTGAVDLAPPLDNARW